MSCVKFLVILETIRRLSQGRLILLSIVIIIVILIVIYFEVLSWSIPRVSTTSRCLSRAEIRQTSHHGNISHATENCILLAKSTLSDDHNSAIFELWT